MGKTEALGQPVLSGKTFNKICHELSRLLTPARSVGNTGQDLESGLGADVALHCAFGKISCPIGLTGLKSSLGARSPAKRIIAIEVRGPCQFERAIERNRIPRLSRRLEHLG